MSIEQKLSPAVLEGVDCLVAEQQALLELRKQLYFFEKASKKSAPSAAADKPSCALKPKLLQEFPDTAVLQEILNVLLDSALSGRERRIQLVPLIGKFYSQYPTVRNVGLKTALNKILEIYNPPQKIVMGFIYSTYGMGVDFGTPDARARGAMYKAGLQGMVDACNNSGHELSFVAMPFISYRALRRLHLWREKGWREGQLLACKSEQAKAELIEKWIAAEESATFAQFQQWTEEVLGPDTAQLLVNSSQYDFALADYPTKDAIGDALKSLKISNAIYGEFRMRRFGLPSTPASNASEAEKEVDFAVKQGVWGETMVADQLFVDILPPSQTKAQRARVAETLKKLNKLTKAQQALLAKIIQQDQEESRKSSSSKVEEKSASPKLEAKTGENIEQSPTTVCIAHNGPFPPMLSLFQGLYAGDQGGAGTKVIFANVRFASDGAAKEKSQKSKPKLPAGALPPPPKKPKALSDASLGGEGCSLVAVDALGVTSPRKRRNSDLDPDSSELKLSPKKGKVVPFDWSSSSQKQASEDDAAKLLEGRDAAASYSGSSASSRFLSPSTFFSPQSRTAKARRQAGSFTRMSPAREQVGGLSGYASFAPGGGGMSSAVSESSSFLGRKAASSSRLSSSVFLPKRAGGQRRPSSVDSPKAASFDMPPMSPIALFPSIMLGE